MLFSSWLRTLTRPAARRPAKRSRLRVGFRPRLEVLEGRDVPSTLTVTNTNDGEAGSLRAQIAAANSGDTVAFDPSVAGQMIGLAGELVIDKNLTIEGNPGPIPQVIGVIENVGWGRVIHITGPFSVTLENLGVIQGFGEAGAGIYNNGGTLMINDCSIAGNSTHSPAGIDGGGIYNDGGTVTINRSIISNNETMFHYVAGGGSGGAVFNNGGTMTINDSTLSGNIAYTYGGGIYNSDGKLTLSNTTVNANYGYSGASGLYNTVRGIVIVKNTSSIEDVKNLGVVYLDSTSTIGVLNGNAAIPLDLNSPQLQIGDVSVTEGNTGTTTGQFTVTLSASSTKTVTVAYATANGTATAGSDYQATSGTLTFAPGETSKTITVLVNGDTSNEPDETFNVVLSGATNATLGKAIATGTIQNDDALPSLAITDVASKEGNVGTTPFAFTVTLSVPSIQAITVAYATANGTATSGSDYKASSGILTFAPGETSKTVTVLVNGDRLAESNETFFVNLSAATNATILNGRGVGTIIDDEPHVSISDLSKLEGKKGQTTLFTFTVTLSAAYDQPVTMSFKTTDGTAKTSGQDYVAKTGTLTFAPGETTKTITIQVKGDSKKEANETFHVDLFGLSINALFTKSRGIGTILNDD